MSTIQFTAAIALVQLLKLDRSGAASTIFLYLVDVKKSRVECEEFVRAEAERAAFVVDGQ